MPRPTVDQVKAELRIQFNEDNALIQSYIDAAAESVFADLNWITVDVPDTQTFLISPTRFISRNIVQVPLRGVSSVILQYYTATTPTQLTAVNEAADTFATMHTLSPNRYHSHMMPRRDWGDILPDRAHAEEYLWAVATPAVTAPDMVLMAIRKYAVDMYRNNGVGTMPMITAVGRLLAPLQDNM